VGVVLGDSNPPAKGVKLPDLRLKGTKIKQTQLLIDVEQRQKQVKRQIYAAE